jgi:dolichol-phosphate mannosyltransferase
MKCALVMPAYNESQCIESVLLAWLQKFDSLFGSEFTIIVVNDGSKDNTGSILDKMASKDSRITVVHKKNGGHGSALYAGYERALETNAEWIFQTDSDDQFLPTDFQNLWDFKNTGTNFIMGHRLNRKDAAHRIWITWILRKLLYFVFGVNLKDANIPYRLINAAYLKKILALLPKNIFAPNVFLTILAARDRQNLGEFPIHHRERETGTVSIVKWNLVKVCFRCVRELLEFRLSLNSSLKSLKNFNLSSNS